MNDNRIEAAVGLIVIVIAGWFLIHLTGSDRLARVDDGTHIIAEFTSAQGVSIGSDVRLAGVKIGTVTEMEINPLTYKADVTLIIKKGIEVREDSFISISSEGLLGGHFVELHQGNSPIVLEPGDRIFNTQAQIDLLEVLAGFSEVTGTNN